MKRKKYDDIHGWLIIDKPSGIGSTDVVNQTRRLLNANKNGHTGTLDPFATGVLPIAFGEATKLIPFVTDGPKEYEFDLCFGTMTDTGDPEGAVCATSDRIPTEEEIRRILPLFIGRIEQIPPVYSALKINGERAYDLVRRGAEVEMKSREIEIYNLVLLNRLNENTFRLKVNCSKGTYVRALGRDLALKLDTVGYLTALRRTKCAIFSISDTILLENLKNMVYVEDRQKSLLPVKTSLRDIAVIAVSEDEAFKLRRGQGLSPKNRLPEGTSEMLAVAVCCDCLIALVRIDERKVSPIRVFNL